MKKRVGFRGGYAALEHHKCHTPTYVAAELLTESCKLHLTGLDDHFYAEFLRTAAYALKLKRIFGVFLYFITHDEANQLLYCCYTPASLSGHRSAPT